MATIRIYDSFYDAYLYNDYPYVTIQTSSHIQITDGSGGEINYYGSFTYIGGDLSGGTITAFDIKEDGSLLFQLTDGNYDIIELFYATYFGYVEEFMLSGSDTIYGASGDDLILGFDGNDQIFGNGGNDYLSGDSGNDILDGGLGDDYMEGGSGNDTYIVNSKGDTVVEYSLSGIDTVKSSVSYILGTYVENLTLTGTYNLYGIGNWKNNTIIGNSGDNILNGKTGADTMMGGDGNDTYIVDNKLDTVTENFNEGNDTIISRVSYVLGANQENLELSGFYNVYGVGNSLNNMMTGNSGDNTLNGKTGADTMMGGDGNDTYIVDNKFDTVTENFNEGIDTIVSRASFKLGSHQENLSLDGTYNLYGVGNAMGNQIDGNSGDNILKGWKGNDIIDGGEGNDILTGGLDDDILTGGLGNDTFVWSKADISDSGLMSDSVTDFDASVDIIDLSDLLADSSHTIEGLAVDNEASSGQHLQLSLRDGSDRQVQVIDLEGITVTSDLDATNTLNNLLSTGAVEDGV